MQEIAPSGQTGTHMAQPVQTLSSTLTMRLTGTCPVPPHRDWQGQGASLFTRSPTGKARLFMPKCLLAVGRRYSTRACYLLVLRRNLPKHTFLRTRLRRVILLAFIHRHRRWPSAQADKGLIPFSNREGDEHGYEISSNPEGSWLL